MRVACHASALAEISSTRAIGFMRMNDKPPRGRQQARESGPRGRQRVERGAPLRARVVRCTSNHAETTHRARRRYDDSEMMKSKGARRHGLLRDQMWSIQVSFLDEIVTDFRSNWFCRFGGEVAG